jgi:hypothetical protein
MAGPCPFADKGRILKGERPRYFDHVRPLLLRCRFYQGNKFDTKQEGEEKDKPECHVHRIYSQK